MFIADRNVYGCDLNPVAVELAEVSLWLNTIYKGAYVPWFGTQLVNGNSLIGARRQVYSQAALESGKWYEKAPRRIMPNEARTRDRQQKRTKEVYHFLLGDPGMANYSDKVIKSLEPDKIKYIKEWNKKFTSKFDEDDIETVLRLSDIIDDLWKRTVELRKKVEEATSESLSIYGYEDNNSQNHTTIREKDAIYKELFKSEHMNNAGPYARLKAAMDYWCALWFWPIEKAELLPDRQTFFFEMSLLLEGTISPVSTNASGQLSFVDSHGHTSYDDNGNVNLMTEGTQIALEFQAQYATFGRVNLDELRKNHEHLDIANKIAIEQKFNHWELEFADVFEENGGFDLVVGNPPWIRNEWKISDVVSEYDPLVDIRKGYKYDLEDLLIKNSGMKNALFSHYEQVAAVQNYNAAPMNYDLLDKQPGNLYKLFAVSAWWLMKKDGYVGLIHPEGLYDNPYGERLRKVLYPKLRYHFEFINEKYLFKDVAHTKRFSINIASNIDTPSFITITNLFDPKTIEECFEEDSENEVMGIKDDKNEWNIYGHPDRKIVVTDDVLKIVGAVFDGKASNGARMPELHANSYLHVYEKITEQKKYLKDVQGFWCNQFYNETSAKNEGLIIEKEGNPDDASQLVFLGPNIWIGNPYNKTARFPCVEKSDYDNVDLYELDDKTGYLPRTKYFSTDGLRACAPSFENGEIYRNKAVLSKCGINVRGRSSYLRINYRTTEEIRKFAFGLLNGVSFDDLDDDYDNGKGCQSLTHGDKPEIKEFATPEEELDYLVSKIHELETAGVEQKNICIVARTHKLLDSYIAGLQRAGIKSFEIKANKTDDRTFEGVRIATMHRVKGLEFDYVFAVAVNKKVLPFGTRADFEDDISLEEFRTGEKCLLYVALTRARKSACVTCYGGLSELIV